METVPGLAGSENEVSLNSTGRGTLRPDFLNDSCCLPRDLHVDWLCTLITENLARISDTDEWKKVFLNELSTQFIFTVCVRLRLPQEVKYSAALIFDSFMLEHVEQLYSLTYNTQWSERKKYHEWERVEITVSRQITLRILSAIQIASKLHSYHDSLSRKAVQLCLKSIGYAYTEESVMRSEIRLLTTLNWKTQYHCTPVVYAETLLKLLAGKWDKDFDADRYWQYVLLVLDCVFLYWNQIYTRMLSNVLDLSGEKIHRERFCRVEADWLLLGAGIVATAAGCVDGMEVADEVIVELQTICGTPVADITDMCVAIMECVMTNDRKMSTPNTDSSATVASSIC